MPESTVSATTVPAIITVPGAGTAPGVPAQHPSLDRSLLHGIAWTGGVKWGCQIINWMATLLVARLLTPGDYGLMGMASIYLGLVMMVTEFGVGTTIVSLRHLDREQVKQLNGFAILFGVAGFLVSCAAAVPVSHFFHAPKLVMVLVVMSTTFVISSLRTVPFALMQKDLRFRPLAVFDGVQSIAISIVNVILAWLGFGYWTLVFGNVAGSICITAMVLLIAPFPIAWPRVPAIREALAFCGHLIGGRICWYAYSNADMMVLGRVLGEQALGVYSLAWTLAGMAIDKVSALVLRVTPAIFAAVQEDVPALRRYFLMLTEGLALATIPMTIGLALVARDFVELVLGPKWEGAIVPLQLLSFYASFRSITPLLSQILNITGYVRMTMWNSVHAAIVLPIGFVIASRFGPGGVAVAWIVLHPLVMLRLYITVFRITELRTAEYLRALIPALQGSIVMAVVVNAVHFLPLSYPLPVLKVVVEVLLGAAAYTGTLYLLHWERIRTTFALLRR